MLAAVVTVGLAVVCAGVAVVVPVAVVLEPVAGAVGGSTVVYVWLTHWGTSDAGYWVSPLVVAVVPVAAVVAVVLVLDCDDCQYMNATTMARVSAAHAQ